MMVFVISAVKVEMNLESEEMICRISALNVVIFLSKARKEDGLKVTDNE